MEIQTIFVKYDMNTIMSDYRTGAEVLNLSNPGDYPYNEDDDFDIDYEIVEI